MDRAPEMPAKTKRPSMQFYPGDWQRDAALRSCSVPARGLWLEMICVMHQAEPYGHLVVNGKALTTETLARMVGCSQAECKRWQRELEDAGVFSRVDGVIVSRRMVRDEEIRRLRAEGGKLGGNPNLVGNLNRHDKVDSKVNLPPNLPPTPSSSSSLRSKEDAASPRPDDCWSIGIRVLSPVLAEPKARAFIGKLLREHAEDVVKDALEESESSADPRAYVQGILKSKPRKEGSAAEVEARYQAAMRP